MPIPTRRRGNLTQAFIGGIFLNIVFVILEASAGFWLNSLALLTDAAAHLVVQENTPDTLLSHIRSELVHHFHLNHATIQMEKINQPQTCDQAC